MSNKQKLKIGDAVRAVCPNSMTKEIYRVYKFIDGFDDRVMLKICKKSLSPHSELSKISDDYSSEYKLTEIELVNMLHIVDNNSLHYFEDETFNAHRTNADFFAPAISASVFETRKEAFEFILKQSALRVIYHKEQEHNYRHLHNVISAEIKKLEEASSCVD